VDHPDDVKVDRKVDEMGVLLSLHVNAQDMVRCRPSGRDGKGYPLAFKIVGVKNNARVNLKIEEPEGGTRAPRTEQHPIAPMEEEHTEN